MGGVPGHLITFRAFAGGMGGGGVAPGSILRLLALRLLVVGH